MAEPLDSLVGGWKRHFAPADQSITWLHSELELSAELAPGIWLAGCVDTVGETSDGKFFGEWKTANPREKKTWKNVWRMNPQSLSYGVLIASKYPDCTRFTVRKAFKEQVPMYDHAWFRYNTAELDHWRGEIIGMAREMQWYNSDPIVGYSGPWPTNFARCFKFGEKYACPFFECACNQLKWDGVPTGSIIGGDPTWSMTSQRATILSSNPSAIVLSPTTIVDWLDCREMYRRKYVELVTPAKNDALVLGGDFHHVLGDYYKSLVKEEATSGAA